MFRHGHGGKSRKGLHVKPGLLPGPGRTIRGLGWGYTSPEDLKNLLALGERWIQPGHQSDTPPLGWCVAEAEAVLNWATPAFFLRPLHQSPELCKGLCHRIGEGVPSLFSAGAFPPRPPTIDLFHHLHGAGTLMNRADFVRNIAGWLVRGGPYLPAGHRPAVGHRIPEDFVGMCVASSPDPACDDYIIDRCNEMGFRQVRVDYTFGSGENHTARSLERLLDDSFRVLLHLVQPLEEAKDIESQGSQNRWREFVSDTLDRWGDRIDAVEIGSTINRHKWAGYPTGAFMIAWRIAHDVAKERGVRLVGPNVTDFEPFYKVAYLAQMHRDDVLPEVQTTNLFAERAYEPEFYDHWPSSCRLLSWEASWGSSSVSTVSPSSFQFLYLCWLR